MQRKDTGKPDLLTDVSAAEPAPNDEATRLPLVTTKDGKALANSRDVAAFFGKSHRHVLRDIDNLITDAGAPLPNFGQGSYTLPSTGNQEHRCYDMDRDGFSLLAMGFTGAKALKWKLKYIEAFKAMEAEIERLNSTDPLESLRDPAALRTVLLSYTERVIALEAEKAKLTPKAEALDRLAAADGSFCITDAAKVLQVRPKDLFDYLRSHGWTYRRPGGSTWLGYQPRIVSGDIEHKVTTVTRADGTEREAAQVRITAKGLTKLAQLLKPAVAAA